MNDKLYQIINIPMVQQQINKILAENEMPRTWSEVFAISSNLPSDEMKVWCGRFAPYIVNRYFKGTNLDSSDLVSSCAYDVRGQIFHLRLYHSGSDFDDQIKLFVRMNPINYVNGYKIGDPLIITFRFDYYDQSYEDNACSELSTITETMSSLRQRIKLWFNRHLERSHKWKASGNEIDVNWIKTYSKEFQSIYKAIGNGL